MMTTRLYTHPSCLEHDTGPGHPESPERLRVLLDLFAQTPYSGLPLIEANEADLDWILRAHSESYVFAVEEAIPRKGLAYLDNDTIISPGSWRAALHAAGAVCQAVADVMRGDCRNGFCAIRPPGHHAVPDQAMGFCLFNNIMIGALHAQEEHGATKVAIVDFDVHHGNGSAVMTRNHDRLFYASTHQWPHYPGTGRPQDNIKGRILNVPLLEGDGSREFRAAYSEEIFPALEAFAPDLILISAGFDAHRDDPLAGINLVEEDYRWVTLELMKIADRQCGGRIVSALEGGYNLAALKSSAAAHIGALAGF